MDDIELSRMIYEALSEIRRIETALVSMWPLDGRYTRVPFLRFRFKDTGKDDVIYTKLNDIVSAYSGNLQWALFTKDNVLNYFITPRIFADYWLKHGRINMEAVLIEFTEEKYRMIVNAAVEDVPDLAKHLKVSFAD
ncbi:hypothetical protein [Chitinophaga pinensis]|uniref:Uncharacterized protein n=1 Tax=Chitinophaga pinensis TaxID=79329 RepID=A0A5C6LQ43_9BACT|nr:hypothetical protein [Chitinophaga pinensis]TWV99430.1 hypothetical protein FEF09_16975 [Chitinophaga pinensis]